MTDELIEVERVLPDEPVPGGVLDMTSGLAGFDDCDWSTALFGTVRGAEIPEPGE